MVQTAGTSCHHSSTSTWSLKVPWSSPTKPAPSQLPPPPRPWMGFRKPWQRPWAYPGTRSLLCAGKILDQLAKTNAIPVNQCARGCSVRQMLCSKDAVFADLLYDTSDKGKSGQYTCGGHHLAQFTQPRRCYAAKMQASQTYSVIQLTKASQANILEVDTRPAQSTQPHILPAPRQLSNEQNPDSDIPTHVSNNDLLHSPITSTAKQVPFEK